MMVTLGLFYIFMYLINVLNFCFLAFYNLPIQLVTSYSIINYFTFINKYTRLKSFWLFLIFSLTGLPPVGLFFIKVNILLFLLYNTHFFIILLIFLFFFLNMIFYIQVLAVKNYQKDIYSIIDSKFYSLWNNNNLNLKNQSTYSDYYLFFLIVFSIGFLFFSIFLFTDLIVCFYKCQQ